MSQSDAESNPGDLDPGFGKGKFHVSHASDSGFENGLRGFFAYRDLGMAELTNGKVCAHVIRPNKPWKKPGDLHYHVLDFHMIYCLKGWIRLHFEGVGEVRLEEGSCLYQEPGLNHRILEYSDDFNVIEITLPADFKTVGVTP